MLKVKNLTLKLNNKTILSDINFSVENGEIFTIIGSSGSGKTSILKSIVGIYKTPDTYIELDGQEISTLPIEKRNVTLVFQEYTLFPHMTIEENMRIAIDDNNLHKLILEKFDVYKYYKKYPHQLSGGEQQRVAIARAIAYKPKLLLLDEPFSNIDAITTKIIRPIATDFLKQFNITTIMVTHDIQDVWMMSDKVMIIDNGKKIDIGTPKDLHDKSTNSLVKEIMKF